MGVVCSVGTDSIEFSLVVCFSLRAAFNKDVAKAMSKIREHCVKE